MKVWRKVRFPEDDVTFLMMLQLRDSGTFTLTRKLRNVLAAAIGRECI